MLLRFLNVRRCGGVDYEKAAIYFSGICLHNRFIWM